MRQGTQTVHALPQHAGPVIASLQIVCAWCQQPLGWQGVQTPIPFQISYSICARCYADVARELLPPKRRQPHVPLTSEKVGALMELVRYNKVQYAALVERFNRAVDQCKSVCQDYETNGAFVDS